MRLVKQVLRKAQADVQSETGLANKRAHRSNGVRISRRTTAQRQIACAVRFIDKLADGRGFEPRVPFGTHAFQACTIDRSVTHPCLYALAAVYDPSHFSRFPAPIERRYSF